MCQLLVVSHSPWLCPLSKQTQPTFLGFLPTAFPAHLPPLLYMLLTTHPLPSTLHQPDFPPSCIHSKREEHLVASVISTNFYPAQTFSTPRQHHKATTFYTQDYCYPRTIHQDPDIPISQARVVFDFFSSTSKPYPRRLDPELALFHCSQHTTSAINNPWIKCFEVLQFSFSVSCFSYPQPKGSPPVAFRDTLLWPTEHPPARQSTMVRSAH